jgi:hypothetical protein
VKKIAEKPLGNEEEFREAVETLAQRAARESGITFLQHKDDDKAFPFVVKRVLRGGAEEIAGRFASQFDADLFFNCLLSRQVVEVAIKFQKMGRD